MTTFLLLLHADGTIAIEPDKGQDYGWSRSVTTLGRFTGTQADACSEAITRASALAG